MDNNQQPRKKVLSCIQPTGVPTLGNYLGALKNWKQMGENCDAAFAVADLHAITVRQEPKEFKKQIMQMYAMLLALGLDTNDNIVFVQSHVPEHSQLAWILNCYAQFGELSRMTQFKDKSLKHADNVNVGLFSYPVLMAADILLYKADYVPVGVDQKQHLEITRDIAERFNGIYGNVFTIPEPYIGTKGAKITSLQDPTKKMSKSDLNTKSYISMLDKPETIIKKMKSAVTDSEACVRYDEENKPGVSNLMTIYSCCTGLSFEQIEKEFESKGYGDFKTAVGEAVSEELRPIRENFARLMGDKAYLEATYKTGAERAESISNRTLTKVKKKIGLLAKPF